MGGYMAGRYKVCGCNVCVCNVCVCNVCIPHTKMPQVDDSAVFVGVRWIRCVGMHRWE